MDPQYTQCIAQYKKIKNQKMKTSPEIWTTITKNVLPNSKKLDNKNKNSIQYPEIWTPNTENVLPNSLKKRSNKKK